MLKKAAMFGLDARIALAIFGALSVISGAALYNAIQQAHVVALVADIKEVEKALEQFMLDTGNDVDLGASFGGYSSNLVVETGTGWNGPYLPYVASGEKLDYPKYTDIYLRHVTDKNWVHPGAASLYCSDVSNAGKPCYYWILINGVPTSLSNAVDIYIDGSTSPSTGNVRVTGSELYVKSIPTLKKF